MNTPPETMKRKKWHYTLLKHTKNVALYELSFGKKKDYEVMKLRYVKEDEPSRTMGGKIIQGRKKGTVILPSTSEWGHYGWSYTSIESADRKFNKLTAELDSDE